MRLSFTGISSLASSFANVSHRQNTRGLYRASTGIISWRIDSILSIYCRRVFVAIRLRQETINDNANF